MGRRSIKSTKSGKFMNPTDQARKEARKKELKKNKKQRQLVRTSVLKNKDAGSIIRELDKLDEMEYNPLQPPVLAEKVLKDKRKKLKETLDRVMKLYQKEEPTFHSELRQIELDYERRRFHRIQYFEAVKQAEAVSAGIGTNVEDIPLPPSAGDVEAGTSAGSSSGVGMLPMPPFIGGLGIPLPPPHMFNLPPPPPLGILKGPPAATTIIDSAPQVYYGSGKEPPGPPPGYPPDLDELGLSSDSNSSSGSEDEAEEVSMKKKKKSVRFQQSEDVDEMEAFMKEVEEDLKQIKEDDLKPPGSKDKEVDSKKPPEESDVISSGPSPVASQLTVPPPAPFFPPLPPLMQQRLRFPPPGISGPFSSGMAPPPPPPRLRFGNPRFGPGSSGTNPPKLKFSSGAGTGSSGTSSKITTEAMISAKPQIRSLSADVTRFIPVAVKTRKDDSSANTFFHKANETLKSGGGGLGSIPSLSTSGRPGPSSFSNSKSQGPSRDDAYADFMKEMEGIL